ncbi:bifunctional diaminohydroxyphosphoribosylaminopyrimidine deaminase/5-amino-6-(5-phosphoribosylamino)uracil reductase RibD [Aciduricibacillus chroicocephali]|uniref:Riboflavin biosynthesis protein RibD n=1 Tax=Aciduricibacillus chroicocephali TaxID=3054939 RepID=A0ABY9KYK8_9BACI|nr:bifunctional diaminohydroxyphosphoribosylaminopyrimidine deaminase/5-amino-6-(5-phosphoribosylamino)uracil reductase RibD [Bacillaceae bacterium 44XB]
MYMKMALNLAQEVAGQTSPNPPVGAVVVKDGEVIGFGAHLKAGGPHAEVHAINMAGERVKGATIYVTLEPCSHYGKTPPCAELIVKSGIKRCVVAVKDVNDLVAGKGIALLQESGIEVEVGVLEEEALKVNEAFFHYVRTKMPYVTLKTAASLDGKTATHTGESKWITGSEARVDVHRDRHKHDAILVGVNTVIQDNPSLTARIPGGSRNPLRIIMDTRLNTPEDAVIVTDQKAETWIFTSNAVSDEKIERFANHEGVRIFRLEEEEVTVETVLRTLGEKGIMTLYVEGGAAIHASFLEAKLFNQVILYFAPKLIGGREAPTVFAGRGFASIEESMELVIETFEKIGPDLKIVAKPKVV